jgi:hypothetical protein
MHGVIEPEQDLVKLTSDDVSRTVRSVRNRSPS